MWTLLPLSIVALVLFLVATKAGPRGLAWNTRQAATISPQAVAALRSLRALRLPLVRPPKAMLLKMRSALAEIQRRQVADLTTQFGPTIESTTISGVRVSVITPRNVRPENQGKIALYVHGGGYIMGCATDAPALLMANELGLRTFSVEYQLAPEAKFPVAMQECLAVYQHLLSEFGAANIVGVSASAGAGHLVATLLKARALGLPMIRALCVLSPSVDLTDRGDSVTANDGRDVLAYDNQAEKFFVRPFAGTANLEDPFVSPIYGQYDTTFPATVIVSGTRDGVLSGAVRLYWKLRAAHVHAELLISEGMWHGFFAFPDIPEAIAARRAAGEFLLSQFAPAGRP